MKQYKISYLGSSRGNKAIVLHEEVISEEEYRQLTVKVRITDDMGSVK